MYVDLPLAIKVCKVITYANDVRLHIIGDVFNIMQMRS